MSSTTHAHVVATIDYIRRNDCDFLTIDTLQVYTGCTPEQARAGLVEVMGPDWLTKSEEASRA